MPRLHLQGRWLSRAGFDIGATVRVQVAPGRLVIEILDLPHCTLDPSSGLAVAESAQTNLSNTLAHPSGRAARPTD